MDKPPKLAKFLLRILTSHAGNEALLGDIEEVFHVRTENRGRLYSRGWYWLYVVRSIPRLVKEFIGWRITMLRNYLKIVLRNMGRHKVYTFINLAGLAVGLACTVFISLWVSDEMSYDRFHQKADRIYRVVFSTSDDGVPTNANGSFGVGPALKREFPEVVDCVRFRKMGQGVKRYIGYKERKFYESRFFFAEPSVFSVFDFPLLKGDPQIALKEPNSIVLTEAAAHKYFGSEDPIGKTIEADPYNDGELMLFQVTGIAANVPVNSHIHFDFLASYISQKDSREDFNGFYQHFTYVLLKDRAGAASFNGKLLDFLHRNWREDPWYTLGLQPLLDIHLHSRLKSEIEANGNILYVYLFTAIALFVLVIACINFMNLTTARAVKRAKEVGIRKVAGAQRNQLIGQFLGESLWLSLCSTAAAIFLVVFALGRFNSFTGKDFSLSSLANIWLILGILAVALVVGLFAGIYPAFFLSAFQPANSLKPGRTRSSSGAWLRKGLVLFQFALSIGIIASSLLVRKQMNLINSGDLGYDRDRILVIPLNKDLRERYEPFRNELLKNPRIENTSTSGHVPTRGSMHLNIQFDDADQPLSQVIYAVDKEFLDTYGLTILSGENIRNPVAEGVPMEILVSELTTKEAGFDSPDDAVGKSFTLNEDSGQIKGVVKDINIYSLHRPPYSISYAITSIRNHNYLSIRTDPENISETLGYIGTVWKTMIPDYPLDYFFLDSSFEEMHQLDKKMGEVFSIFSVLAICVACLGLFGLAAFTAEQRTKEIGVRKVLGASTTSIYRLLLGDFLKWVLLANFFAWPAAYFGMDKWLQNFAFRTNIGLEIFLVSAAVALAVALLTVSLQSLRAANSNPVDSLRYE